jgi:hypothetical protein
MRPMAFWPLLRTLALRTPAALLRGRPVAPMRLTIDQCTYGGHNGVW